MENQIETKNTQEGLITNVRQATQHYFFSHPVYYISTLMVIVGSIFVCFFISEFYPFNFALVFLVLLYSFISTKIRGYLMEQFAKSLGYEYFKKEDGTDFPQGSLFSIGHDQNIKNIIKGKIGNRLVRIFLYSTTVGYGKSAHRYFYTVFENTFEGNMPHMLLHKSGIFEDPIDFSNSECLKLEGDFNKYFSFHVEKEFEIEAYQIFDPDFMAELIDSSKSLNFEFFKNKLYIYTHKFINERSELDEMFNLSNKLCSHIEPEINRMRFNA